MTVRASIFIRHICQCCALSPWASYQIRKIAVCACAGNAGNVFRTFFAPPPRVSDPDMHHGTCVTNVPWCMPGSLTGGFLWSRWQENVPSIPGGFATRNLAYLVRGPWYNRQCCIWGLLCIADNRCFHFHVALVKILALLGKLYSNLKLLHSYTVCNYIILHLSIYFDRLYTVLIRGITSVYAPYRKL